MADSVRINGNAYSWGSIVLKLDGERFVGVKDISYDDKRERTFAHGMNKSHKPIARSRGKYTPSNCKVTMLKSSAKAFRAALAEKQTDKKSFGDTEFGADVMFDEPDVGVVHDELLDCVIVSNEGSHSDSPDPLYETFEIQPMGILWDGKSLFSSTP
jgi:hypothetical protein